MNININQKDLKDAIEKVERLLHKSFLPVLDSVLLQADNNKITITVNNLTSTLTVNVDGEIIDPGSILIDKSNFKLIKKLSGFLSIKSNDNMGMKNISDEEEKEEVINNTVTIKANRNLKFTSTLPEEYPEILQDINEVAFTIAENIFKDKLKIKAFVAKNHFRQVFNGVLIFKDDIVTSNTHHMVRYKLNTENKCDGQINIPIQSINELDKILNNKSTSKLQFTYKKDDGNDVTHIQITGKDFVYITRLTEGVFPNYEAVIPNSFCTEINIEKHKLQDTVEFIGDMITDVKDNVKPIVFDITDKLEARTSKNYSKSMSEILPSDITGDELLIGFNSTYIDNFLKTIKEDKINIKCAGKKSPAIFIGENNECELYVLVPLNPEIGYDTVA